MPRHTSSLALALMLSVAPAAQAGWYFNPAGGGFSGASFVAGLTVGGFGFIEQRPSTTLPLSLEFEEHGAYRLNGPSAGEITVTYAVEGAIGLSGSGFTGGVIDIWADDTADFGSTDGIFGADNGVRIASFEVTGGLIDPFNLRAGALARLVDGTMAAGYFFDASGHELAGRSGIGLLLGIQSEHYIPTAGDNVVAEIVCEQAGFTGPGCNDGEFVLSDSYFTVQDVGIASLDLSGVAPVSHAPEPSAALMMLAGLLGIGAWRRIRQE